MTSIWDLGNSTFAGPCSVSMASPRSLSRRPAARRTVVLPQLAIRHVEEHKKRAGEPPAAGGRGGPQAGDGFLRQGDPANCYPFIEAEKAQRRNVKRACELLKVSRAAYYAARDGSRDRDRQDAKLTVLVTAEHKRSKGRYGAPRIHRSCAARAAGTPASGSPG
jgi:hypothetical protein